MLSMVPALLTVALMAPPQDDGTGGLMFTLIPLLLIFAVFWFFIIRPQKKRENERQAMIEALEKGDKVVSAGGIHGTVTQIDDTSVLVQVDNGTKLRFEKSAIGQVLNKD